MKVLELLEAIPSMGSTTNPMPQSGAMPAPTMTGNTQQLADPKLQAVNLAQQNQIKDQQKKDIAAQIQAKQKELQALQKQQSELNRAV
ncbi:MAG: hypothetical protein EBU90_25435 [Proteobacteria bacterium]|nr:hypothetical protein [Pseudomonadota bacterium]NBP16384.1 hypothetical protein [bacterium]